MEVAPAIDGHMHASAASSLNGMHVFTMTIQVLLSDLAAPSDTVPSKAITGVPACGEGPDSGSIF